MTNKRSDPEKTVPEIDRILSSPGASNWLKDAIRSACRRDPVDAWKDANLLQLILKNRMDDVLQGSHARVNDYRYDGGSHV